MAVQTDFENTRAFLDKHGMTHTFEKMGYDTTDYIEDNILYKITITVDRDKIMGHPERYTVLYFNENGNFHGMVMN